MFIFFLNFLNSKYSDSNDDDEKFGEQETNNNYELIDLTKDESNSYLSIDIEECPICLETFTDLQSIGISLIITPCHHVLCTLCISQLLSRSSRCPLCQRNISSTTLMPYCILA